ncbi:hypothetical protein PG989_015163 [Apiospora arundinis]
MPPRILNRSIELPLLILKTPDLVLGHALLDQMRVPARRPRLGCRPRRLVAHPARRYAADAPGTFPSALGGGGLVTQAGGGDADGAVPVRCDSLLGVAVVVVYGIVVLG